MKNIKKKMFLVIIVMILALFTILMTTLMKNKQIGEIAKTMENEEKAITSSDGEWEYDRWENSKTARINLYLGTETDIVIPSEIDGYRVEIIATNSLFGDKSTLITSVIIPNTVKIIGKNAFLDCTGLTNIEIPSSVTEIESGAFMGCTGLTNIEVPSSVTKIGNFAFSNCTGLTNIEIPSSVTIIQQSLFKGCTNLTSIELPDSIITIMSDAFEGCTSLTSIELPKNLDVLYYGAFEGCTNLTTVNINSNIGEYFKEGVFGGCSSLTNINITQDNEYYMSENGVIFSKDKTTLVLYAPGKTETTYTIPSNVNKIHDSAFLDCKNLSSIKIPNTVTEIGDNVFNGCEDIKIQCYPNSVAHKYVIDNGLNCEVIPVSSMSIKTPPAKLIYKQNEESLNLTGGIITLKYSDGIIEEKNMTDSGVAISGFDNTTKGMKTITVSYEGKSATFQVEVIGNLNYQPTLEGDGVIITGGEEGNPNIVIPPEIGGKPVTEIGPGAFKDRDDLESIEIPDSVTNIADDAFEGSEDTIIICNPGSKAEEFAKEHDMSYIYKDKTITGISVKTPPTKTIYKKDIEVLDLTGGRLTVKYQENGLTSVLRMTSKGVTATGFSNTEIGTKTITVGYTGKTATLEVKIIGSLNYQPTPEGDGIIITGGEEGNPNIVIPPEIDGKPVTEIGSGAFKDRDDLESIEIPDSVTNIADDAFEGSEDTIIICNPGSKAEEFAKEHDMSYIYKDKTITGISVKTPPTKTIYKKDIEVLDLTGGRLTVKYQENGLTSVLRMTSKGVTATGFSNTEVGKKPVTVSYVGKTATFEVTVEAGDGIVQGDISGDGIVDSTDLLLMKRHIIAGNKTEWILTGDKFTRGDINSDGVIDSTDLLQLKRKIVNR